MTRSVHCVHEVEDVIDLRRRGFLDVGVLARQPVEERVDGAHVEVLGEIGLDDLLPSRAAVADPTFRNIQVRMEWLMASRQSQGGHGDGPLMVGEPAPVLVASGEVTVNVGPNVSARISWIGEPFVDVGNGVHVSSGAASGCIRLNIDVQGLDGPAEAAWGIDIENGAPCDGHNGI